MIQKNYVHKILELLNNDGQKEKVIIKVIMNLLNTEDKQVILSLNGMCYNIIKFKKIFR